MKIAPQDIARHLDMAEAGIEALSDTLGGPAKAAHLDQLEDIGKALYGASAGMILAGQTGGALPDDAQPRLTEAEETADLIGRHLAMTVDPDDVPERLRKWQTDRRTPHGSVATDVNLSPDVVAALLAIAPESLAPRAPGPAVPLTAPLVPMIADVFADCALGGFIADLVAAGRIVCDPDGATGFAYSIAPTYGALPVIYVPLYGTYRDLVQLAHHVGHGYHQMMAQRHGTVLNPITPDIDEIIPLSCELQCHAYLQKTAPEAADWIAAQRNAEVAAALAAFQQDMGRQAHLPSYSFGAIAADRFRQTHGWRFDLLDDFARAADRASPDAIFAA